MKSQLAFCTVISKNFLAQARVLAQSLADHHAGAPFHVLLVDRVDGCFDAGNEPFDVIPVETLKIPELRAFLFRYDMLEANTAAKPWLVSHLMQLYGYDRVVYLDADMRLYAQLSAIPLELDQHEILLTPHLLRPSQDGQGAVDERDILRAGTYNAGFMAIARGPSSEAFLQWLCQRTLLQCRMEPTSGYFCDQRWLDLVPGSFDRVGILRDPAYNVAYWNLHERQATPPKLMHFSGFDPARPQRLSRHCTRVPLLDEQTHLRYAEYAKVLLANGYQECRKWPYAFGFFDNGLPIFAANRREYLDQRPAADPFAISPNRFCHYLFEISRRLALAVSRLFL